MVSAIIELGIGYFITYHVPGILNLSKKIAMVVKIVGIVLLLMGFVDIVQQIANLLHVS